MDLSFEHGWLAKAYDAWEVANTVYTVASGTKTRFTRIREGVAFTAKFLPTYHLVVLAVLLIFTIAHWTHKIRRNWQRGTTAERGWIDGDYKSVGGQLPDGKGDVFIHEDEISENSSSNGGSSSSSSSTLDSHNSNGIPGDDLPLLKSTRKSHAPGRLFSRFRSVLMYQPPPIPVINKVLPSNGESIFAIGLVVLNLFYLFYGCPMEKMVIFILAGRTGYLFVVNLPLLYFLAAKNQPIKFLTGYSYESLNLLHRRLGEVLCTLALLHAATMTAVWYTILRPTGWTFVHFLTQKIIYLGLFAFVAYEVLYLTSLGSFRQRWYELFLVSHVFLQAAGLILLFFHHSRSRIYVGLALAIFLVDRVIFRLALKTRRVSAKVSVAEDGKTVLISSEWEKKPNQLMLAHIKQGWNPIEHVFLTIPALSSKDFIQAHPFTIASAAPEAGSSQANLDLIVRAQDGFTKHLLAYAKQYDEVLIQLDGPYGSQTALDLLLDSESAIVVAGGSGIAVAYPLVCALLAKSFAPETNDDVEGGRSLGLARKICLIWVTQQSSHHSWLGDDKLNELRARGVDLVLPPPTAETGRPDVAGEVRSWVSQYSESSSGAGKLGVVCSGPDGMNRAVRNTCATLAAQGQNVHVDIEKFGW